MSVEVEAELYFLEFQRNFFFSSKTQNLARLRGSQHVAEPHEKAGGNSRDADTTAWRGENDKFPSPAAKAGFHQACSVLTLPPGAETGKRVGPSAPYHSG